MGCALADWPPVGKPMRDRKPKTPPIAKVSPQSPGRTVPWGVGRLPRSSPAPQLWRGGWWLTTEARVGTWSPVTPHQLTKLKGAVQRGPCRMPPEGTCRDTFPGVHPASSSCLHTAAKGMWPVCGGGRAWSPTQHEAIPGLRLAAGPMGGDTAGLVSSGGNAAGSVGPHPQQQTPSRTALHLKTSFPGAQGSLTVTIWHPLLTCPQIKKEPNDIAYAHAEH